MREKPKRPPLIVERHWNPWIVPVIVLLLAAAALLVAAVALADLPCPQGTEDCEAKLVGACNGHGGVETGSGRLAFAGGVARCTAICNDGMAVAVNTYGCWEE